MKKILSYGVKNIIYIACKPKSFARDLPVMMEAGYEAERLKMVDMFPRTGNCEVICKLSKQKKPDAYIDLEITAEEYEEYAGEEHRRIMEEWKEDKKKGI